MAETKKKVSGKKTPVKLLSDYWDDAGIRQSKGSAIAIETSEAKRLIKEGYGERADPYPGEEE